MGYWYTPMLSRGLRLTGKFVTGALTNSRAVAELTSRTEHIPAERVHVVYNGYLSESSDMKSETIPELAQLKDEGAVIVGLVANIRPIKRIGDLIDAVALLTDTCPDLQVVIIGGGDNSCLRAQATEAGLQGRIHFLGARPNVKSCLAYFDLAVLCSESEGFSNAVVEYMQAGLPVVCTATGGNPEAVTDGETGYLYPVGNVVALARLLELLYKDGGERRRMGSLAKVKAEGSYSIDKMVQAHQAIYLQSSERV
jgi:glycosyltransferase involved in cell wall biosynthesis